MERIQRIKSNRRRSISVSSDSDIFSSSSSSAASFCSSCSLSSSSSSASSKSRHSRRSGRSSFSSCSKRSRASGRHDSERSRRSRSSSLTTSSSSSHTGSEERSKRTWHNERFSKRKCCKEYHSYSKSSGYRSRSPIKSFHNRSCRDDRVRRRSSPMPPKRHGHGRNYRFEGKGRRDGTSRHGVATDDGHRSRHPGNRGRSSGHSSRSRHNRHRVDKNERKNRLHRSRSKDDRQSHKLSRNRRHSLERSSRQDCDTYRNNLKSIKDNEERKTIFVGGFEEGTTRSMLRERFQHFGRIVDVSIHIRDHGDNYGFITFSQHADAFSAIERGNDNKDLPSLVLCFGGRRAFCKEKYSDLDCVEDANRNKNLDFDSLLKLAQAKLRK